MSGRDEPLGLRRWGSQPILGTILGIGNYAVLLNGAYGFAVSGHLSGLITGVVVGLVGSIAISQSQLVKTRRAMQKTADQRGLLAGYCDGILVAIKFFTFVGIPFAVVVSMSISILEGAVSWFVNGFSIGMALAWTMFSRATYFCGLYVELAIVVMALSILFLTFVYPSVLKQRASCVPVQDTLTTDKKDDDLPQNGGE